MDKKIAVITGDIINSSEIKDKKLMVMLMKEVFIEIEGFYKSYIPHPFEIFRGDSFQVVVDLRQALRIALVVKAGLLKGTIKLKEELNPRISIGIGDKGVIVKFLRESNGEAFHISGKELDNILAQDKEIGMASDNPYLLDDFHILCTLLNVIVRGWSPQQAEVVYYMFMGKTQQEIANMVNISQASVSQRMQLASWKELTHVEHYYDVLMDRYIYK